MRDKLINIITSCDYFGVTFNFHYKTKEKFRTITGGMAFILFILISLMYVLINLISLLKRENMSIISHKIQIPSTDRINFQNYSLMHAFRVKCSDIYTNQEMEYFKIDVNHVILTKDNGIVKKQKQKLNFTYCHNENFFNKFNNSFIKEGLNNSFCFDNNNITIEGLYTDEIYQYVELTVTMTKSKVEDYQFYYNFLTDDDCTFQLYHLDYGIDITNHYNPISPYMKQEFLKLSPVEFNKMEVFYFTQKFISYENFFFNNFNTKYYAGFSYFSFFNLYKGNDRFIRKPNDYNKLAKFFIRTDNSRNTIIRKYMKFTEFLANVSSLISPILLFLFIIMTRINKFYAKENIMSGIFQFKDIQKGKKLLINKLKQNLPNIDLNILGKKYSSYFNGTIEKFKKSKTKTTLFTINKKKIDLGNFNKNNNNYIKESITNDDLLNNLEQKKLFHEKKLDNENISLKPLSKYNLCQILIFLFCPFFSWKDLRYKNIIYRKIEKRLYLNTDFLSYIKNNQILELLTAIILEPNEIQMIKFLSKPIISLDFDKNRKNKITWNAEEDNYISETEINEFLQEYEKLQKNINRTNIKNKLFDIINLEIDNLIG